MMAKAIGSGSDSSSAHSSGYDAGLSSSESERVNSSLSSDTDITCGTHQLPIPRGEPEQHSKDSSDFENDQWQGRYPQQRSTARGEPEHFWLHSQGPSDFENDERQGRHPRRMPTAVDEPQHIWPRSQDPSDSVIDESQGRHRHRHLMVAGKVEKSCSSGSEYDSESITNNGSEFRPQQSTGNGKQATDGVNEQVSTHRN